VKRSIQDNTNAAQQSQLKVPADGTLAEYVEAFRAQEMRRIVTAFVLRRPSVLRESETYLQDMFMRNSVDELLARKSRRGRKLSNKEK